MSFRREEGRVPEAASDCFLPWWEDLSRSERLAVLEADVDRGGFTEAQVLDIERRVLDGEPPDFWMDGVGPDGLAEEFGQDEPAARDSPTGVYQVWHERGDGQTHVADVQCGNLLAAVVPTMDGYPGLEHMVRPVGGSRPTDVSDKIIDPNGKEYEIAKEGGFVAFKAVDKPDFAKTVERYATPAKPPEERER